MPLRLAVLGRYLDGYVAMVVFGVWPCALDCRLLAGRLPHCARTRELRCSIVYDSYSHRSIVEQLGGCSTFKDCWAAKRAGQKVVERVGMKESFDT